MRSGIIGLLILATPVVSNAGPRPVAAREIDALFATWDKAGSPGAALAVIHEGKIVYERGYGRANIERDTAITSETAFYVGSVSKQFAAASIALLAQRGTLSLDDDVRTHVPELPDYGSRITIRHLIHHTSGLRDYLALRDIAGEAQDGTFDDRHVLALICRQKALNFQPGSQHLYSNSGYFLLSILVKRITGMSLRQYAAKNIFEPLGMKSAQFRDDHRMVIAHRAEGYAPNSGGGYRVSNPNFDVVGAGGVFMTVRDFLAWDENFHSPKVGDRALIELLETPGKLNDGTSTGYAFGLTIGAYRGLRIVEHGGSYGGFKAHVLRFPAQRFSVVCFTNLGTMAPGQLARNVAALYLGSAMSAASAGTVAGMAPSAATVARSSPANPNSATAALREDQLVGKYYSDELQVAYRIAISKGELVLHRGGRAPMPLRADPSATFRAGTSTLTFQRDPGGRVSGFTLDAGRVRGLVFARTAQGE